MHIMTTFWNTVKSLQGDFPVKNVHDYCTVFLPENDAGEQQSNFWNHIKIFIPFLGDL